MKVVRVLVGIIGVLLLIFAGMALIGPKINYNNEVTINAPKEKVWQIINDTDKGGEWLPGLKKVEVVKEVPGKVGNILNMTYEVDGKTSVIKETFTEFKENESLAFNMEHEIFYNAYRMDLTEENGQTKVRSCSNVKGKGFFFRGMIPLMKKMFKQQDMDTMKQLKELVEKN